jgi:hypothetical protein
MLVTRNSRERGGYIFRGTRDSIILEFGLKVNFFEEPLSSAKKPLVLTAD